MQSEEAETILRPDAGDLLRRLRESARDAADATAGPPKAILDERMTLRRSLVSLPFDEAFVDAVREHLSHVETRIERLEGRLVAPERATLEILELRGDLVWLPLRFPERGLDEAVAALTAEVTAMETVAREIGEEDEGAALAAAAETREGLAALLRERLDEHARIVLEAPGTELDRLCEIYLEAEDLSIRGEDTREIRHRLRPRIAERAAAIPPVAAERVLSRFAEEAEDRALDMLAAQAELPTERAAAALETGRRELVWMRRMLRDVIRIDWGGTDEEKEADRKMKRWRARLARANRRLAREAQEVRLQSRLEGIFGRRFTAFFENLILWLILAVLGILIVEALIPDPHPGPGASAEAIAAAARWRHFHRALVWADAGICAVFLLEFFTKLSLVRGKVSWFLRHFLIDFVPSIPYGLIAASTLDVLQAGRVARFARVPRLLRYVRVARPVVRFFRFFGFLQRGLDRMVRLHGNLLNRNVVMFEPAPMTATDSPVVALRARLREIRALARRTWRRAERDLPAEKRSRRVRGYLARLPGPMELSGLPTKPAGAAERTKMLRAEELISELTSLDPGTVEAEIGEAGAERFAATLDRIDVPVVRLFPGLKQMVRAARGGEALDRVVRAGRALGRWLQKLLAIATWFSDLSGVISGPQFLDRLGSAMVQATARPAKRLLIFGLGFLVLNGFAELVWDVPDFRKDIDGVTYLIHEEGGRWLVDDRGDRVVYDPPALVAASEWLKRTLGTPFLVLGTGCLVILLTGSWFKRIAGEATDFYTRTAEAQYINLLKSAKLANLEEDLSILWERALRPEYLLRGGEPPDGAGRLLARYHGDRPATTESANADGSWAERILQLYYDYLDGALFHSSDTKTTSQLLGNLALENIRTERLKTSRKERRRLGELDLDRERSALRGPYLWFRSINHSVAQWTAKLLLEYNRRAIPVSERLDYPDHVLAAHEEWLERKIRGERPDDEDDDGNGLSSFVTTEFTALHFLTADEDRDAAVRERFGEKTLAALRADRRAMIRTIFGTYPFHRLPRADRTVNPFDLYGRYLAGGRAAFFPLYVVRLLFRGIRWLVRRIRETLNEILNPARVERDRRENWASYDVAERKIHRMRKPLFMECARFRATFDPEYLGIDFFPEERSGLEGRGYREDLQDIGARDEEWDPFDALRAERATAFRELGAAVEAAGGPEAYLAELRAEGRAAPWREAWRAVAIAYAIDYRDARTLAGLRARARELVEEAIAKRGRVGGVGLLRRFFRLFLPARSLRHAFREFLVRFAPRDLSRAERRHVFRAVRSDHRGFVRVVQLAAALEPATSPEAASREILRGVARHPDSWSEQLVTLRTVQSLSVLDVRNYRRQVRDLGGYENG